MYYLDKNIKNLDRIFDQNSREGYLRLDLNENPEGLPQDFINKVLKDITPEFVAKYPETLDFTQILADYLNTDIDHICLTNGSSEGIRQIIEAFTSPNGRIVGVTPTYAMFEVYPKMYGRNFIPVKYADDLRMPVENILKELTPETELLILLNPNNPMGNAYSEIEFQRIIDSAKQNEITVLIDEAYMYFYPNSFINYALTNGHIFVTRTFSKLFSLAGCRLGYVVGWPEGIKMVQKLCTPHNVNAFAMKFAKEIIKTPRMIDDLILHYKEGKEFLIKSLKEHEYSFNAKEGNFIFIKPKTDAYALVKRMKNEESILIKTYSGIGKLGTCLRVTTGGIKPMKRFLEALYKLDLENMSGGGVM
ncbi:pyridoxal phosphate-dependent aminotransferase [Treponema sp. UBA6852]|uniref:pyridoxal phosphate-dependent aminotransferase n=1 Tax=Treponema sp. UBA6852 TaxID=1947744 RepID=UPI0025D2E8A7|nr:histidinol-phosphate transaminase [Treponema sp. UBA6852]